MATSPALFITRELLPHTRCEYLFEFAAYLRQHLPAMPEIAAPKSKSDKDVQEFRDTLHKVLIQTLEYKDYGQASGLGMITNYFKLLQGCCSEDATMDLRDHAESRKVTPQRPHDNAVEFALLLGLAEEWSLLRTVSQLSELKKGKAYQILIPDANSFAYPMLSEELQDKALIREESHLSGLFQNKNMTSACQIQCERIADDVWFTIHHGQHKSTIDEVNPSSSKIVARTMNPGNKDIVIYVAKDRCLYVNLQMSSKPLWLLNGYAGSIGNILFGVNIWTAKPRYDLRAFNGKSIREIEEAAALVEGISEVRIYKLTMHKSTGIGKSKELLIRGFSGQPYKSISEIKDADGQAFCVPQGFYVHEACIFFMFDSGQQHRITLKEDSSGLKLGNEHNHLMDRFLWEAGIDTCKPAAAPEDAQL